MIRKLRRFLAILTCKTLIIIGKLLGKPASATPGKVALRIAPDLLRHLAAQVRHGIIAVSGTNGKTTTNNFIFTLLQAEGYKIVCNHVGANMLYGVVTAFAAGAKPNGKLDADYACIELDELWAVKVFQHFSPSCFVMTNLFRDQLDRYGEIDITIESLKRAVRLAGDTTLILNADDPLLAALGTECSHQWGTKCVYFGVDGDPADCLLEADVISEAKEGRFCRMCGAELAYEVYYYSQLGRYTCPICSFVRPTPAYAAEHIDLSRGIAFDVCSEHITADYRGFYNIYNMLAAYVVLRQCGIDTSGVNQAFTGFRPQVGRMETFAVDDKQVVLNLSKNPAGFNQAISTLMTDPRPKAVVLVINDNERDGCDISWLWDVDFERLQGIPHIAVSGLRANDVLVRMKYAGFHTEEIFLQRKVKEAIDFALLWDCEVVYTLVNYTALFDTHDLLKRLETGGRK